MWLKQKLLLQKTDKIEDFIVRNEKKSKQPASNEIEWFTY